MGCKMNACFIKMQSKGNAWDKSSYTEEDIHLVFKEDSH